MEAEIPKQVLVDILTERVSDETRSRLAAGEEIFWEHILESALKHGVAPLVYWRLKDSELKYAPERVQILFQRSYFDSAATNLMAYHDFQVVQFALQQVGIPLIALKGLAFASQLYENIALRPMGDIDVLVPLERLEDAATVCEGLGYVRSQADNPLGDGIEESTAHIVMRKRGAMDVILELHWSLFGTTFGQRSRAMTKWAWQQIDSAQFLNTKSIILRPEAALVHGSAHIIVNHGHGQQRLIWLYDLDQLIRKMDVDWVKVVQHARILHLGYIVYTVLRQLSANFGTVVPDAVMDELVAMSSKQDRLLVERQISSRTHLVTRLNQLQKQRSIDQSLGLAFRLLFPGRQFMLQRYKPQNPSLWWMFYLSRWWSALVDVVRIFIWQ